MRCFWHRYQTGIGCVFLGCAFFLYPGYFTIALPLLQPPCQKTHAGRVGNFSKTTTNADPVKCNHAPIITLKTTLTVPLGVLYLKHNKGVEHNANHVPPSLPKPKVVRRASVIHRAPQVPQPCPYPIQVICQCPCILHPASIKLEVKLGPDHSQSLCITSQPYNTTRHIGRRRHPVCCVVSVPRAGGGGW